MLDQDLTTLIDLFYHWEKNTPDAPFLKQPFGGKWKVLSYREAGAEARKMTRALQAMGLEKGDHIGILSKNCYHWILADLAIMMGGFVSVPFYASLPEKQLREVIVLSDLKALFLGKLEVWGDRANAVPDDLPTISFPHYKGNAKIETRLQWDDLMAEHQAISTNHSPHLDDLWTILFTSGTTGTPKGVIHSFRNPALVLRIEALTNFIGIANMKGKRFFSFLPLNHVGERIGVETNCLSVGGSISFAESIDTFVQNLQDTQPSLIFAVPRIWTKFYLGVLSKMPERRLNLLLKLPIVSGIIKRKIKTALGLGQVDVVATGAAITPAYLKNWYKKMDLHLIEAYGMTEVCGCIANGPKSDAPADSVGQIVPYCEVKIDAETQEILMKAPYQMLGYYKDPIKTAEVIRDGWIYSGDRGSIDEQGYLRVVGRVKDAFKTSKGKYIVPNPMEEVLATNDFIEQVCVTGSRCAQPLALINLSELGMAAPREEVEKSLLASMIDVNQNLSNYHKISTIVINREIWSETNQLLTPTMKVRRSKIEDCYGDCFEEWHEAEAMIIWS